jgi:4-hydroxybenzoate polyprenyltransferase
MMSTRRAYFQLLRPPNLFTVPGDPLCGFLLATHGHWSWRILPCVVVSLSAYCAGLVINDLADFSEDLRDRPARPLPSGAVARKTALNIAIFLIALALVAAASVSKLLVILAALLIAEILWYNLLAKRNAFLGPIAMGLCRGLSVLVGAIASASLTGATAMPHFPPLIAFAAASVIALYIAGVTDLARKETSNPRIPPLIGLLIRCLLFIQAAFCVVAGGQGWIAAILLLALWPLSRLVSSYFYAS